MDKDQEELLDLHGFGDTIRPGDYVLLNLCDKQSGSVVFTGPQTHIRRIFRDAKGVIKVHLFVIEDGTEKTISLNRPFIGVCFKLVEPG